MNYPVLYKKDTSDFTALGTSILKNASEIFIKISTNGEYIAEFDLPAGDSSLNMIEYDDFIKIKAQLFRVRSISAVREEDGVAQIHIKCFHVWYDACDCKYIPHAYTQSGEAHIDGWIGVTPKWVMEKVFKDTPFTVGDVEIDTLTDIFATKSNPAEIVSQLIDNVGGVLERDNYTVHLRKENSSYNGKWIMYGRNLKSIEKTMDDSAVITRLYPLGEDDMDITSVNGGKPYIDSPLKDTYGYIKCGYIDYPHINTPEKLMEAALAEWSNEATDGIDKPKITYTVDISDFENIEIDDTVRVCDSDLGVDILTNVCSITFYPFEPHRGSITLSNHRSNTADIGEKILTNSMTLEKITDDKGNIMSQYIDNVRQKLQSCVGEETAKRLTVHQFGDMWVDNLEHPTKAMVITDGLFAVANSKKSNGDWDWRTIGTADEFIADTISAGWLNAGYIDTDKITIRSSDGGAALTGNSFTITTTDGFEATMSAEEGFKYVFSRDSNGNPYDYVTLDHTGQKRYWRGHLIPSTYQFAKGKVVCGAASSKVIYEAIELKGPEWLEVAKLYNKIIEDTSLTDFRKAELINSMINCSVVPSMIKDSIGQNGAVVVINELITREIGEFTVPQMVEVHEDGTYVELATNSKTLYYDGAALVYHGAGGYVRTSGSINACYALEAAYDVAVTLDIDYE